ncbi:MAG TPA: EamA family transporter [Steroidobacteraceae bacterium]|nr:EamA family transporter [Steroidobacteraceae bacterium]
MQMLWLGVAIAATVAYHIVMKLTPAGASPFLSLAVTYGIGALTFALVYAVLPGGPTLRAGFSGLNWTAFALAIAVVGLDVGFLLLYRGGFDVSLGQIITQSAAALLLVLIGVAFFAEKLSLANIAGILLCVVGLVLINRK